MALFTLGEISDPVNALFRLQEELERAFESPLGHGLGLVGTRRSPAVNIFRQGDDVVDRDSRFRASRRENLSIESQGQTLDR